ncbi:MAG: hypothetical protein KBB11_00975 [Bacteroidales bacterium]|nr:hypothetical protein [Bacteroidales bacterium]HOY38051.1 hypothetical protein [Bacteroidales bacterium]HQP03217.1 hypothetical protein [Bacteroidales bacterium]
MLIYSAKEHEKFLREIVIEPPGKMLEAGFTYHAVILMAQSIEIFGAYFDNKPFRSIGQSLNRFALGIDNLFPYAYHRANARNQLYKQLRALFVHSFLPGTNLQIKEQGRTEEHLEQKNATIIIIPAVLHNDVLHAGIKLIKKLNDNQINPKKVSTSLFS